MLASRNVRIGLALALAMGAVLVAWFATDFPSVDRARRAYERRDWLRAASIAGRVLDRTPGDPGATRVRARGLARVGDDDGATPLFAGLGGGNLGAEDLMLIGRGALGSGRPDLGRAAIEAACRLDPRHAESVEALDALKAASSASGRVDRLLAVPGDATLSELVAGLAEAGRGASTPGDPDPVLDRVVARERSIFARLDSPDAARKLLARALLEGGRARKARDRLAKVEAVDDAEAHGLLARAWLVEGDKDKALAESARSGRFGLDAPMAFEPSRYAGAARCAGCHREIYRDQQAGHHATTVARGEGLGKVPLPGRDVVDPENPGVVHRFDRTEAGFRVTSTVEGRAISGLIEYAMGSGTRGMTMLARGEDGRPRSLRISSYSGGRHWALTSGFEPRPVDPHSYVGEPLNEESFANCLGCHMTRTPPARGEPGPERLDLGIGCERCHGPGDLHVRAVESGFDRPAIARPRLASPSARMKLCAQCHGSDGVIPPADPRFVRFQAATLPYSRCVTESGGRLDCVACHDPHRNAEADPSHYEARCLACHGKDTPRPGLRLDPVPARPCPVDAVKGCVSCHMPKGDEVMPFTRFTDHHIRVHRPAVAAGKAAEPARGPR